MAFRIQGLSRQSFSSLLHQPESVLEHRGARRVVVDATPGVPDRITLDDVPIGETALLLNYLHQPAATPFRASHAIFVRERGGETFDDVNVIPPALARRLISLRAFDANHLMIDADIAQGGALPEIIERTFDNQSVAYLHAHYAKWGCYAARVDRA